MSAAESKREREKQVVQLMIRLYCKKLHGTQKGLCPECRELAEYAVMRSDWAGGGGFLCNPLFFPATGPHSWIKKSLSQ